MIFIRILQNKVDDLIFCPMYGFSVKNFVRFSFSKEYSRNVLILVQIKDRTEISKDLDKMLNLVWLWNTQKEFWQLNHVAKELSSVSFFIFTCCKYFSLMNRISIDHYEKVSLRKNKRIWTFNLFKSTIRHKKKIKERFFASKLIIAIKT